MLVSIDDLKLPVLLSVDLRSCSRQAATICWLDQDPVLEHKKKRERQPEAEMTSDDIKQKSLANYKMYLG